MPEKLHKLNGAVNISGFASVLSTTHATAKRWLARGMPSATIEAAREWAAANRLRTRTPWRKKLAGELGIHYGIISRAIKRGAPDGAETFALWWKLRGEHQIELAERDAEIRRLQSQLRYWRRREHAREVQRAYSQSPAGRALRHQRDARNRETRNARRRKANRA